MLQSPNNLYDFLNRYLYKASEAERKTVGDTFSTNYEGSVFNSSDIPDIEDSIDNIINNSTVIHNTINRIVSSGTKNVTFIVGPEDNEDSDGYDYVTNGVNDHVQIQEAIDDLPADGGKIVLREGTYTLGDSVDISSNNVTFEGMGAGTIIHSDGLDSALWIILSGDYCVLHGMLFDGESNDGNFPVRTVGKNPIVKDCYFLNIVGCCIQGRHSGFIGEEGTLTNCTFLNFSVNESSEAGAIDIFNGIISECIFNTNVSTDTQYILSGGATRIVDCSFLLVDAYDGVCISDASTVTGCDFYLDGTEYVGAVIIESSNEGEITNNFFYLGNGSSDSGGITILCNQSFCSVSNNTIIGGDGVSIYVNATYCTVTSNVIYGTGEEGIVTETEYGNVSNNIIRNVGQGTNNTYSGILISTPCVYSTFIGNTVSSDAANKHKYGIREEAISSGPSVIVGNILRNAATSNLSTQNGSTVSANNITT